MLSMEAQMVVDKSADKKIAVIVASMTTNNRLVVSLYTGGFKLIKEQLLIKKLIGQALVD